jgi:RNA recognition motif-containing protein
MPAASSPSPLTTGSSEQSPGGEKPTRRLEDLLPNGRRPTSTRENSSTKVFVGGLNPKTTTEDLRGYFSSFGVVVDGCVITDALTKVSRGFGFVEFDKIIPDGLFDMQHIIDQRRCGVREYSQSTSS